MGIRKTNDRILTKILLASRARRRDEILQFVRRMSANYSEGDSTPTSSAANAIERLAIQESGPCTSLVLSIQRATKDTDIF